MLSFAGSLKILLALEPCDMGKGLNGLSGLVTEKLGEDPRHGALFVFSNRRHTRLKILFWDVKGSVRGIVMLIPVRIVRSAPLSWQQSF